MEYRIDRETGEYPLSVSEIWRRHPNTMMAHHLERYALIELAEMPVYDEATHKPVEIEPVEINGVWRQQWFVVPLNAEELADLRRQDEEAAAALIPRSCTRRQGRLALLAFGLDDDAEAAIAAITDPLQNARPRLSTSLTPGSGLTRSCSSSGYSSEARRNRSMRPSRSPQRSRRANARRFRKCN